MPEVGTLWWTRNGNGNPGRLHPRNGANVLAYCIDGAQGLLKGNKRAALLVAMWQQNGRCMLPTTLGNSRR